MNTQPTQPSLTREQFIEQLFAVEKKDNILYGKDGVKKLVTGIEKGFDAIAGSYGSSGSNVIIEAGLAPGHKFTNDGRQILDSIKLADPIENMGLNVLKEVAKKSDEISGDGRKTSVILTHAIVKEGLKCKGSPMEIKRSLDECLPIILKSIDDQTKQVTVEEIDKVAEVASESKEMGRIFGELYRQIGSGGIVELDNSNLPETSYEITEGVKLLGCGFHYPYMANEDKGRQAVYKNPYVLITKQKITNIQQLDPILKHLFKKGHDNFVIFCDEIDVIVSQALSQLHQGYTREIDGIVRGVQLKTLVIKAPTLWKDWIYEDFSKITGATIIDGIIQKLERLQLHQLGTCDKIVTTKDQTIVLGTKDIKEHLEILKEMHTDESEIRIARLCTKTAILKLGANSESELSYFKGKALDARNASFLALQGGIVKGAGLSLFEIATMDGKSSLPNTIGGKILTASLCYPYNQIIKNSAVTNKDLKNIFDPAIVVKNSITNALSVAGTVLTAKAAIMIPK